MILADIARIKSQIKRLSEQVEELEAAVTNSTPKYTAVPKAKGKVSSDIQENYIMLKDKLSGKIEELQWLAMDAESRVASIKDPLIASVIGYKYIDGYSWAKVAIEVGGDNTPDSCRMMAKRYIKKHMSDFM